MNSSSFVITHRDALDSEILLCRDRREISLDLAPAEERLWTRLRKAAEAVGLGILTAIICAGGFLAHIVR